MLEIRKLYNVFQTNDIRKAMKQSLTLILTFLILATCIPIANTAATTNPIEDTWATKAPMNQARADFGLVTVGDKIYAIGGSTSNSWRVNPVATNEEYDSKTDTWTTKAAMPTSRAKFAMAAYGDLIYCIGGVIGQRSYAEPALNGMVVTTEVWTKAIEVYNTTSGTWETKKNSTAYLGARQTHVINDTIYSINTGHTSVYNITNDSWTEKARMPIKHYEGTPISTSIDNKIFVASLFEKYDRETHLYIYDTATDNWTKSSPGYPFYSFSGIAATTGTKAPKMVYVFGTYYPEGNPKLVTQAYNVENDTWIEASPMSSGRYGFGSVVINDKIYTIGGGGRSNINEQYTPIGYSTPPTITFTDSQTKTYNQSNIILNFTVDKPVSWTGYSLDNQANITFTSNLNLTNLPNGNHNITLYANDTYGTMGSSETRYFTVDVPALFPIELVVIAAVAVGVTLAIVFVYRRRAKR
ncbi:MAG TPA: hypothetical protein VLH35_04880 [Candidatus Acidoferrales bacterium]|nr:hypothetical protein [Candidatus Acidoferrales bacterium]